MKIGIICEGEYTDRPVLEKILTHKFPSVDFEIIARNKEAIFEPCYYDINLLINKGISNIIIFWDLLPVGHQMAISSQWSEKPSRKEQRENLLQKLVENDYLDASAKDCCKYLQTHYGFNDEICSQNSIDIKLVCVCYTMDGWLLSDQNVLKLLVSTNAHPIRTLEPRPDQPDRCKNPVGQLTQIFKRGSNRRFRAYNKFQYNSDIVKKYIDEGKLDAMRISESYCRLIDTIEGWVNR